MFTIIRLEEEENIFFIVKKDILSETGSFLQLPFSVYGFLRVEGSSYVSSTVSYKNIADELTANELNDLAELAKLIVWNVD